MEINGGKIIIQNRKTILVRIVTEYQQIADQIYNTSSSRSPGIKFTTEAVDELNAVLTKTTMDDAFGVGANLPAYSGEMTQAAILEEIYRNRRIELYLTGLSLEDTRRFGRPGSGTMNEERNRDYYPYPNAERDNNAETPPNPPK